jgi:predicted CXXCH cytochrome family protein
MKRAAALILLAIMIGCDHKPSSDASDERPVPAAAAPDDYLASNASVTPVVAVAKAPKPTGSLAKEVSCVTAECHASLKNAAQIHRPIAENACGSCHGDDIGGHRYPLKRGKTETCTFCHNVTGTAQHQHAPLKDGCSSCHEPHVSQTKFLLKADNVEQLCFKCHNVPLQRFAHEPFAKGQCTLCHEPHQSANAKFLRGGEGNDHCLTCHTPMKSAFAAARSTHKPALEKCTTCHSPHSSEFAHELKSPVQQTCLSAGCHDKIKTQTETALVKHDAMKGDASCAACHNPHYSPQAHLLRARTDEVCATCHKEMAKTIASSQFRHGPVRAGECSACHDPHGGRNPGLLDRSFPRTFYTRFALGKYDLCFNCHEPQMVLTKNTTALTNFRDGEKNLHFIHVNRADKGRSCKSCHNVHASNLPNHMASEVPFEGSKWSMPVAYQKSTAGGSCTPGCHDTKSYDRKGPATVFPTTRGAS